MADIYRQSRRILVVDADLRQRFKQSSRTELATTVLYCGQMRRSQTPQEALIREKISNTRKSNILFLEGSLEFNTIVGISIQTLYQTEAAIRSVLGAFPQFISRNKSSTFLTRALKYRITSKRKNEALYLSLLLELNPNHVSAILAKNYANARIKKLYIPIGKIPAAILFNSIKKSKNNLI